MSAWYWEDVSSVSGAEKAMNGGFWAALIVAIITALVASLSFFGLQLLGINGWAFVDAGIFAAIAVGIKRKSRFAALAGLCLYVLERLYMLQKSGAGGIVMGILFTLLFINAARGAFAYHRMTEEQQARPLSMNPPPLG
ncbi:MAG TPA: hypothetical protein VI431_07430 [Candidatus Acidoferrum sp.]